jgi:hypothetical protein
MRSWYLRLGLIFCTLLLPLTVVACSEDEHRETTMHEEQVEEDPQPVSPGQMVVE